MSIADLMRRVSTLELELTRLRHQVPVRHGHTGPSLQFLQIIRGQTLTTGQYGINYSASLTLTQFYDPDVDVTYPTGLGNAWIWNDGRREPVRVLVRHDASNYPTPLLAGARRRVLDTVILTVASGADEGRTMTAYTHTWE